MGRLAAACGACQRADGGRDDSRGRSLAAVTFVLLLAGSCCWAAVWRASSSRSTRAWSPAWSRRSRSTTSTRSTCCSWSTTRTRWREEQAALRAQFPKLIQVLTTGKRDGDNDHDFPPAKDLHLGVVTSDMGLRGVAASTDCAGLATTACCRTAQRDAAGLPASYPPFLSFRPASNTPTQIATDFACVAMVGTGGCGFEHQLEAPLKALWPSVDPMPNPDGTQPHHVPGDPTPASGVLGHGDAENAGFLRNDPTQGLSLIAIIVRHRRGGLLGLRHPTTSRRTPTSTRTTRCCEQGMNVRCHFNQQACTRSSATSTASRRCARATRTW